ncbi:MAG: flagellar hook protein FlgE [Anaerolineales bacterium]|nr:flagellar hook protein FlgE [Anaerolineales bacterium]
MLRSMFTAITSLTLHQDYMDVVADNLANVNTAGFKRSNVTFQDQFAQTLQAGSAPTANLGGINPTQIGLGARLGNITTQFTQGTLKDTGRNWDLAIQGDGFFIYRDGTRQFYSRDGSLSMDEDGTLVSASTGQKIMGWMPDASGNIDTGLPITQIDIPVDANLARATTSALLGGNLDSTSASGSAGSYNVTIGAYDSLGAFQSVTINFEKTSDNNWSWTAVTGAAGSGTVSFDTSGQYTSGGGNIIIPASGGAPATTVAMDLTSLTQLATTSTLTLVSEDGVAAGSLTGFSVVSNTGEIYGTYSNGLQELLGQVAISKFVNPTGLTRVGQNLWEASLNSGEPEIGIAGTNGRGTVTAGYLEASNVDLAEEFTNMILAQRGFQAASRVITASDEMLQELVNLKR